VMRAAAMHRPLLVLNHSDFSICDY
jgi:hypothetical protein